ncbi:helix-turn-helix domain-containing protein [Paenibacillus sp. GCM10027626]|uniref:helix-turn-helix domain-containing protein n=1 Tax=Paenibacillus sp. GCM10027626 TaxID=3273411 RepID=UPI00362C78DB
MKRLFIKRSFFRIILYSNLIMLVVPLTAALYLYSGYSDALTEQASIYHSNALKQAEQIIEERLGGIEQSILRLTLEPQVRRFMNDTAINAERRYYLVKLSEQLNSIRNSNSYIYDIFIHYPKSELIVTTTNTADQAFFYHQFYLKSSLSFEDWLKSLTVKNTLKYAQLDTFMFESLGNKEVLTLTQSVGYTGNNDSYATIVFLINADKIRQLLTNIAAVDSGAVYLLDDQNKPLLALGQTDMLAYLPPGNALADKSGKVTAAGNEYSVFTERPQKARWKLMSMIQTDQIMREVKQNKLKFMLISALAVLISLLIAYRAARMSYKPVKKLVMGLKAKAGFEQDKLEKQLANELDFIENFTDEVIRDRDQVNLVLKEQVPTLRSNLLTQLMKGNMLASELSKYSPQSLGVELPYALFAVLLIRIDEYHSDSWEEQRYAKFVSGNVIEHLCAAFGKAYVADLDPDRLGLLLNVPGDYKLDDLKQSLAEAANQTTEFIGQRFSIHTSIGIGNFHPELVGIHLSFREALQAIDYQLIQGRNAVVHTQELPPRSAELNYSYSFEMEMALFQAIKLGDSQKTQQLLEDIFRSNPNSDAMSLQMSKCLFFDVMSTAIKVLNQLSLPLEQIFGDHNPYDELYACRSIAQMQTVTVHIFTSICGHVQMNQTSRSDGLRRSIIEYMEKNYADPDMSLSKLAEAFQLNASYLSNLFKEQVGDNFIVMLSQLRVEAAKALLMDQALTIQNIAKRVGYSNSNTFIRNFRKVTGATPGEFREQNRVDFNH